jgi:hypothetical protein
MRAVECVSKLTARAARNTTKIQYIASAHTKPGSDPGTFRDVSTGTVGNRCVIDASTKGTIDASTKGAIDASTKGAIDASTEGAHGPPQP